MLGYGKCNHAVWWSWQYVCGGNVFLEDIRAPIHIEEGLNGVSEHSFLHGYSCNSLSTLTWTLQALKFAVTRHRKKILYSSHICYSTMKFFSLLFFSLFFIYFLKIDTPKVDRFKGLAQGPNSLVVLVLESLTF